MKAKTGTLVVPFLFILALDQATKIWIDGHLRIYERIPLLTDRLYMTYLRNPGAAFGIFRGWPASIRIPFFVAVSALAVGCIGYFFYRARRDSGSSSAPSASSSGGSWAISSTGCASAR